LESGVAAQHLVALGRADTSVVLALLVWREGADAAGQGLCEAAAIDDLDETAARASVEAERLIVLWLAAHVWRCGHILFDALIGLGAHILFDALVWWSGHVLSVLIKRAALVHRLAQIKDIEVELSVATLICAAHPVVAARSRADWHR
jgi:hypothetical protein